MAEGHSTALAGVVIAELVSQGVTDLVLAPLVAQRALADESWLRTGRPAPSSVRRTNALPLLALGLAKGPAARGGADQSGTAAAT